MALPFVLLVLTLLLVAVSAVAHQGLGTLQQAKLEEFKKQAVLAAEAGVADAIEQMVDNAALDGPVAEVEISAGFEFDVPVRFDADRIRTSVASFQAGEVPDVPVVEVRV